MAWTRLGCRTGDASNETDCREAARRVELVRQAALAKRDLETLKARADGV
jgi:hypothetical protein